MASADTWVIVGTIGTVLAAVLAVPPAWRIVRPRPTAPPLDSGAAAPQGDALQPEVELTMTWAWPTYPDGSVGEESLGLTFNRKLHPLTWASACIELPDGRNAPVMPQIVPPGMALPIRVEAQDRGMTLVAAQALRDAAVDLTAPLNGRAELGTGEVIRSRKWTPDSRTS